MRHFRELKIRKDNTDEFINIINELRKRELKGWVISDNFRKEFAIVSEIPLDNFITFLSPYYTEINDNEEKKVFRGILHFGINNNTLQVIDIIEQFEEEKLPIHRYNYVLNEFLTNVIESNLELFKSCSLEIKLKREKPVISTKIIEKEHQPKKGLVISAKPSSYEIFNKRLKKPIHFIDKSGNGELLFQEADEVKINNSSSLLYFTPNNIAVLLSVAANAIGEAKIILIDIGKDTIESDKLNEIKNNSKLVCDYIEKIQIAIVFSYTALEAFANLSIPDSYEYTKIKKSSGTTYEEKYNRYSIERLFPLKEKLKDILPDIYDTKPIENEKFWGRFDNLENARDKIIHQKRIEHTEFYKEYFNESFFNICKVTDDIITFFFENCKHHYSTNPLWPWINVKEKIFPKSIFKSDEFESTGSIYDK